jgi:signal transduction histidine kinase
MKIKNDFDLRRQAMELDITIWETPSFLFLCMGLITIVAMTATYFISQIYDKPEILVLAESIVVITIFSIGNSIITSMEQMARVNKMKNEFVSVASHQLRTPLSAIRWETELLLSKFNAGMTAKQKDGIESINVLSTRMVRLVSDLLDVARIDQRKLFLKKECVDLMQVTKGVVDEIAPLARAKNVSLIFKYDAGKYYIIGDSEKLRLAIENLVSNAVKYTLRHGKVEVGISSQSEFVVFHVKDSGVGIPKAQQDQVFKKFFRSDNVIKYQTEGTGLGLYIAKSVIERSNGNIWFESQEGIGSIFNFSIPSCKSPEHQAG